MNSLVNAINLKKDGTCLSCGYDLCWGDKKYIHPDQYKNCSHPFKFEYSHGFICSHCGLRFKHEYSKCEHIHKEIVGGRLVCLRCGYEEIRYGVPPSKKCVHKQFEKNYNTVFCVNCGVEGPITFPPVWYWETENNQYIPRISYYNDKYDKSSKPNDVEDNVGGDDKYDGEDNGEDVA